MTPAPPDDERGVMPTKTRMNIGVGLTIDDPPVTVRWGTSESDLQALFGPALRHVTDGYWTAPECAG